MLDLFKWASFNFWVRLGSFCVISQPAFLFPVFLANRFWLGGGRMRNKQNGKVPDIFHFDLSHVSWTVGFGNIAICMSTTLCESYNGGNTTCLLCCWVNVSNKNLSFEMNCHLGSPGLNKKDVKTWTSAYPREPEKTHYFSHARCFSGSLAL